MLAKLETTEPVLCIDPGIGGTGVAVFRSITKAKSREDAIPPQYTEVFRGASDSSWDDQVYHIGSAVAGISEFWKVRHTIMEFPGLWNTGVSHASAASGDLFKLTFLCGVIAQAVHGYKPILVSPQQWKGQLPKDVVMRRIGLCFPTLELKDHMADAVGMGLWAQGILSL